MSEKGASSEHKIEMMVRAWTLDPYEDLIQLSVLNFYRTARTAASSAVCCTRPFLD